MLLPSSYRHDTLVEEMQLQGRGTVGILIAHRGEVLVVGPRHGSNGILPQGGIKPGETLERAFRRETKEELDLPQECICTRPPMRVIGECINPIPNKHIIFVLAHVWRRDWVKLNDENKWSTWVSSPAHLVTLMGCMQERRPTKFRATLDAVSKALGWSWKGLIPA